MRVTKAVRAEQLKRLRETYGMEKTALHYTNPFTFLVAVMLSAQCTDARVNVITGRIFPRLDSPEKMIALTLPELENEIRDCGLYHAKAKHLLETCRMKLPGVGRKTANVVRSVLWGYPAIAVDTHVFRVANRLKLATGKTPIDVELGLQKAIPMEDWSSAHHWLIWHGRRVCTARNPKCSGCVLRDVCPNAAEAK